MPIDRRPSVIQQPGRVLRCSACPLDVDRLAETVPHCEPPGQQPARRGRSTARYGVSATATAAPTARGDAIAWIGRVSVLTWSCTLRVGPRQTLARLRSDFLVCLFRLTTTVYTPSRPASNVCKQWAASQCHQRGTLTTPASHTNTRALAGTERAEAPPRAHTRRRACRGAREKSKLVRHAAVCAPAFESPRIRG
jgi:hypothetical protein